MGRGHQATAFAGTEKTLIIVFSCTREGGCVP